MCRRIPPYFLRENWECHQPGDSLDLKEVGKVPQCLLTCPDLADLSAQLSLQEGQIKPGVEIIFGGEKKIIKACGKMLHILWPFQTASQLFEFAFHPSLPWNPGGKGQSKDRKGLPWKSLTTWFSLSCSNVGILFPRVKHPNQQKF